MPDAADTQTVRIRARSPGKYPILVVEMEDGELRTAYFETGYDLVRTKKVDEGWLRDNAIGRHSFIGVDPPRDMPAPALKDYVRRELLREA